jgi:tetratricopeptide (TPR) repeat protein/DNA-binding XRE family transcriptional regulator
MTGDAATFGSQLGAWRRSAGLSQEELAERAGLSVRTISSLERGRTRAPYQESLHRLADALGLDAATRAEFFAAAGRRLAGAAAEPGQGPGSGSGPGPGSGPDPGSGPGSGEPAPDGPLPGSGGGPVVPRQLPALIPQFTGRHREIAALDAVLTGDSLPATATISAIGGAAGIGKTALAVHWAHQVATRFPDGQLFVNLCGFDPSGKPLSPADALRTLVEALGVPAERLPASTDSLAGLYRSLLADKRILVVLDNARDAAQVRPLLPGSPSCLALITSRSQLTGLVARDGAARITLSALSLSEARQMLVHLLGAERARGEARAADQVADSCGRLPLALSITAAQAALRPGLPLAQVVDDLAAARSKLDGLTVPGDRAADVRAAFSWSYEALPPASQRMFRLLGLHPGPDFSAEAAASLAGVPRNEAALLLAGLTEASLLSAAPDGRFASHDLLSVYAAELAVAHESADDRRAAIGRMLDHYLVTATAATERLDQTRLPSQPPPARAGVVPEEIATAAQALAWLDREYAVLLRLVDLAATEGFYVHAWQLPRTLHQMFDWRVRLTDWEHTHRVAEQAAAQLADPRAQALTYLSWVKCDLHRKRWRRAEQFLRRAYDLFGEVDDRPGQARVLVNLGITASTAGRYRQATDWARRAHALYAELGDLDGQAGSLANQGFYHVRRGSFDAARELLSQARDMFAALGHQASEAMADNNLGLAYQGQGDYQRAIARHQAAARTFAELGDVADQAEVLRDLADAYRGDGHLADAIEACEQAVAILTGLRHPDTAKTQAKLAELQQSQRGTAAV